MSTAVHWSATGHDTLSNASPSSPAIVAEPKESGSKVTSSPSSSTAVHCVSLGHETLSSG
jgi:hypothetical protein